MDENRPKLTFMSLQQPERELSREESLGTHSCQAHGEIDDGEYYSLDNGLGDDWDPNAKLEPLLPFKFTSTYNSSLNSTPAYSEQELSEFTVHSNGDDSDSDGHDAGSDAVDADADAASGDKEQAKDGLSEDVLELFFNSFMDLELEGEVTVCQWLASLSELSSDFSEKELYRLFNHIDEERTGFVDSVDFINFLRAEDDDGDTGDEISRLRAKLNAAIQGHPFMLNFQ